MFVRDCMTPNPVTITRDTPIIDAYELMKKHKIRRLPVVHEGKVVGLLTEKDIFRVFPSPLSTLSAFEANYLLSKTLAKDAMIKRPLTVSPDLPIEEAALLMREHKIDDLLVVEGEKLVGILTQTDIFEAFITLFGVRRPGLRLTLLVEDKVGVIAAISRRIAETGISIISVATFHIDEKNAYLIFRLETDDVSHLLPYLEEEGFKVVHVGTFSC